MPLTRFCMMLTVWLSCADVGVPPDGVRASYTTSRPPCRSRPRWVFLPGGTMRNTETATRAATTSKMTMCFCFWVIESDRSETTRSY